VNTCFAATVLLSWFDTLVYCVRLFDMVGGWYVAGASEEPVT